MPDAREKLNKSIEDVINRGYILDSNLKKDLTENFYKYICIRIEEWTKFVKQISPSWFIKTNVTENVIKNRKDELKVYKNILKKLKLNRNYIPDSQENIDKNIKHYVEIACLCLCLQNPELNLKKLDSKTEDKWVDDHIESGTYKEFISGLIKRVYTNLKNWNQKYYNHPIDVGWLEIENILKDHYIGDEICKGLKDIYAEYYKCTHEEKWQHVIQVSKINKKTLIDQLNLLIRAHAALKNENFEEKTIIEKLTQLAYKWDENNKFANRFYNNLYLVCSDNGNLNKIMNDIFEIKNALLTN